MSVELCVSILYIISCVLSVWYSLGCARVNCFCRMCIIHRKRNERKIFSAFILFVCCGAPSLCLAFALIRFLLALSPSDGRSLSFAVSLSPSISFFLSLARSLPLFNSFPLLCLSHIFIYLTEREQCHRTFMVVVCAVYYTIHTTSHTLNPYIQSMHVEM